MTHHISSPIGCIEIKRDEVGICALDILDAKASIKSDDTLLKRAELELQSYFAKELKEFSLELSLKWASEFYLKVYKELVGVKYGKTVSYKDLASLAGNPKAFRAAASANAKNKIPIIIPCHRVIASSGGLGGYSAGKGIQTKLWLLRHEGVRI